ncbi:JmjC domain-containing protein [Aquabacterium sp.]|uniref:JmjC domain-containing protein n=1 Tax=Aquabacterium sp. TaxID=1872578 RepID=UPI002B50D86B|nr:cupin domain-containing protein [Aquabacterium sp.]HSW03207.1 cupin domain-containing protein [Aquabacterium sp.]
MDIDAPLVLLGGLSPATFMRRHWQKKPLLVRQAIAPAQPPITRSALFELAGQQGVEARLLTRTDGRWKLRHGPFTRRALPPLNRPDWTLLVQGLDLHVPAAHELLSQFRFVPEARLDDLMVSYATPGGGVGPHLDSYDVFLLQVQGHRRWRIGPVADRSLVDGLPVKILRHFEPSEEWLLAPGDMLYLPPLWGHDGVALDECMTCSIGFRASTASELAQQLLPRLAEDIEPPSRDALYRDATQPATAEPGRVPEALRGFALAALMRVLDDPRALDRALGSLISEPKPQVWFDAGEALPQAPAALVLDRRTRMVYDDHHVFINGEAFAASGRDARLMRQLADQRRLPATALRQLGEGARDLLDDWAQAGWLHAEETLNV